MEQKIGFIGRSNSSNVLKPLKSSDKDSLITELASYKNSRNIVWTIPKSKRFHNHESLTKDIPLINPGSSLSKCSTSLGFGKRYTFHPVDTPGSSLTHRDFSHKKTIKFIRSESTLKLSPIKNEKVPGPGSYNIFNSKENKEKGILMKSRIELKDSRIDYPGPGFYKPGEDPIFIKRFKDIKFGTSRRSDFTQNAKNRSPGPASYKLLSNIEKKLKLLKLKNELKTEKMKIEHRIFRS